MKCTVRCADIYNLNDNAHGLRIAGNLKFVVGAFNAYEVYSLRLLSESITEECIPSYPHPELYVYSLVTFDLSNITTEDSELVSFVQIAENMTASSESLKSVVLSIIIVNVSSVACANGNNSVDVIDTVVWTDQIHQEYMFVKVDPQQKYAYVFSDAALFSYELATNRIDQFVWMNDTVFWHNLTQISVRSFDLTNEWALVAGYARLLTAVRSHYLALLIELRPLRLVTFQSFYGYDAATSDTIVYNLYYDLSVSIAPHNSLVAIGAANLNSVSLCEISRTANENSTDWTMVLNTDAITVTLSSGNNGFGRSVAWLDDEGTNALAVLVDTAQQQVWSPSQVRIYPNISMSINIVDGVPDYVFPNSQQQILDGFSTEKLAILQLVSVSNSFILLFHDSYLFYIPSAPFGLCSVMVNINGTLYNQVFEPQTCVGGSYKNKSSPGPCTPCPTQTKSALINSGNNATILTLECIPCEPNSFCPLGASGDVNLSDISSYTQTFTYPNEGGRDNYDDVLLDNFITLEFTSAHCLVVAPLFWLLLTTILCFILCFTMYMMKSCGKQTSTASKIRQHRVKLFLKHIDIIHEGEHWVSGLASFTVFVVIGLIVWFAADYVNLYPIETSKNMQAACDATLRNAKFDNALQLPLPNPDGSQWVIFDMLQAQPFLMSIDVINTAAKCENISVQQNTGSAVPSVTLDKQNCSLTKNNVTVSFSFALPQHQTTIEVDITGPYTIGALRLCLSAPPNILQEVNIVHELDVCSLFYTPNQTIGLYTDFSVSLIKVINITQPLSDSENSIYDGRWSPTISSDVLSDELVLRQYGQYMRYVNDRTSFIIQFYEESYFLQNNQQPIVKVATLIFHTLLFISLIIEIFATTLLIFKLCCIPMFQMGRLAILPKTKKKPKLGYVRKESTTQMQLTAASDFPSSELVFISAHSNNSASELCNNHKWSFLQSNELKQRRSTLCSKRELTTFGRGRNDKRKRFFLRSWSTPNSIWSKQKKLDQTSEEPEKFTQLERF